MSILGSLIGGAISAAINRYKSKSSSSSGSSGSSGGSGGGYSQSAPVSLRDYMSGYGKTPGWNPDTGVVTIGEYEFKPGNVPGTTYNPETGYHYVSDPETINRMLGINSQPQQPQQYPQQPMQYPQQQQEFDPTEYIEQLKTAKRQSLLAALDKARTAALGSLETEKANVAPTYYDARNRAAAASDVGAMNFAQYMAARGIKGAAGAMPEIYRQAGLQGQIGALDRAEANALANIERQRSNIESGYASDVAAAEADVESQAMQALIDQWNANRQYELQKATLTGSLGDQRTLAGLAYDWSRSPSNPAVQAQILANKKAALDIAYQEIINSYLPETEKLKAQELKQKVEAGQYDADIALAQLNQIRAQASSGRSSGGLTPTQEEASKQKMMSWVSDRVQNDPRLMADMSNYQSLQDAWTNMYYTLYPG
jgi:hypothetical protein